LNLLLASTDGHAESELQWFSVLVWRWALAHVLGQYRAWGIMDESEAIGVANDVLRRMRCGSIRLPPTQPEPRCGTLLVEQG
jgi:hypothetical protein